jgi:hypothetical protein
MKTVLILMDSLNRHRNAPEFDPIYDLEADPWQAAPVRDPTVERRLAGKLAEMLSRYDAPPSQFERVGLRNPLATARAQG